MPIIYIYILIEYILLSIVFESATKSVLALEVALGRCAKCRWQSGCLACDPYKCLRFHLHKQLRPRSRLSSAKDQGCNQLVNIFLVVCLSVFCFVAGCLPGKGGGSASGQGSEGVQIRINQFSNIQIQGPKKNQHYSGSIFQLWGLE